MHVAKIERRHGDRIYVSHLVRRSVRDGKRVRHETVANVSKLPAAAIEALSAALRGEALLGGAESLRITDSLPAGHAEAVLGAARRLGLPRLLDRSPSKNRDLALAMICSGFFLPGQSSPRPVLFSSPRSAQSSAWRTQTKTTSTRRWTGSWSARRGSRAASPNAT